MQLGEKGRLYFDLFRTLPRVVCITFDCLQHQTRLLVSPTSLLMLEFPISQTSVSLCLYRTLLLCSNVLWYTCGH